MIGYQHALDPDSELEMKRYEEEMMVESSGRPI